MESKEQIWKKVRKRAEVIKKDMGIEPDVDTKIQKVVLFKADTQSEGTASDSTERLEKYVKDAVERIEKENLSKSIEATKARLAKQDKILQEFDTNGGLDMSYSEISEKIQKAIDGVVIKGNCSRAEALKRLMAVPEFEELCKQYEQEYESERRKRMDTRRQEAL